MRSLAFDVGSGDLAQNLSTEGLELTSFTRRHMDVILEITQISKDCPSGGAIPRQAGKCIVPQKGYL